MIKNVFVLSATTINGKFFFQRVLLSPKICNCFHWENIESHPVDNISNYFQKSSFPHLATWLSNVLGVGIWGFGGLFFVGGVFFFFFFFFSLTNQTHEIHETEVTKKLRENVFHICYLSTTDISLNSTSAVFKHSNEWRAYSVRESRDKTLYYGNARFIRNHSKWVSLLLLLYSKKKGSLKDPYCKYKSSWLFYLFLLFFLMFCFFGVFFFRKTISDRNSNICVFSLFFFLIYLFIYFCKS